MDFFHAFMLLHVVVCPPVSHVLMNVIFLEHLKGIFFKFGTTVYSNSRMTGLDFGGQRLNVKAAVTY